MNRLSIIIIFLFPVLVKAQIISVEGVVTDDKNKVIPFVNIFTNDINAVDSSFSTYNPDKIEPTIEQAKKQIAIAKANLEKLGGLGEDTNFYNATMNLYKLFENQLNNEYAEQLDIYKLSDDEYTEEKRLRYNELLGKINSDYKEINEKFLQAQQDFANSWGMELEKE